MLDAAYKVNGSPFHRSGINRTIGKTSSSSTSFASQLDRSLAQTTGSRRTSRNETQANASLKQGSVLVPKSRSLDVSGLQKASAPKSLLAIAMDKPVSNQAVTVAAPSPRLAEARVSQVADPALSVATVTSPLPADSTVSTDDGSITALQQALQAQGIDTSAMHMEVHNDTISYMMGSYQDRQLVVQLPGGRVASYSADLVARNPNVTVTEMRAERMV